MRYETPNGYIRLYAPTHPLSDAQGLVFEHRMVAYDARGGRLSVCERCRLVSVTWQSCHVDHDDLDRKNNVPNNLVVCCNGCNTQRHAGQRGLLLTINGTTKTCRGWAAEPGVVVSEGTIRNRKRAGLADYDAVFAGRRTHTTMPPAAVRGVKFDGGKRVRP